VNRENAEVRSNLSTSLETGKENKGKGGFEGWKNQGLNENINIKNVD